MTKIKYLLLVPVRNAEVFLPFFFVSLRKQNPKPDMIVWAVNNCTDNTVQILKEFRDIPSEIIELPDFPHDYVKQHGEYEAIALVRQRLWERAREINAEWTFTCDVDEFPVSPNIFEHLSSWNVNFVCARIIRWTEKEGVTLIAETSKRNQIRLNMSDIGIYTLMLGEKTLIVACPDKPLPIALNSTMKAVWGFGCFSRRLVQDRRLNFHPRMTSADVQKMHFLAFEDKNVSEDISFVLQARKLGYKLRLDGVALVSHCIGDGVTLVNYEVKPLGLKEPCINLKNPKPWATEDFEFSTKT